MDERCERGETGIETHSVCETKKNYVSISNRGTIKKRSRDNVKTQEWARTRERLLDKTRKMKSGNHLTYDTMYLCLYAFFNEKYYGWYILKAIAACHGVSE